jgi:hypothetical protein
MWLTQGNISWEEREKAMRIHYLCGLRPDSRPDDNTMKEAAQTIDIEIIGKKQLCRMDHRVLGRAFIVRVWHDEAEPA